ADLLVDDDTRLASQGAVAANVTLARLLLAASGEIEAALLANGKYTPTDLQTLTGASQCYLQKLTADLAHWRLKQRRWPDADPNTVQGAKAALDALERLRRGENIFGLQEVADAGLAETIDLWNPPPCKLSTEASRFFGERFSD